MSRGNSKLAERWPLNRIGWTALLVAAGCAAGARAGTAIVFPGVGAAILFLPYAILTTALILSPMRHWWIYILAAAAGDFWPHWRHEGIGSFVLLAEVANASRAVVAAAGVRWLADRQHLFDTLRGVIAFLLFAVVLGPVVGATIGATLVVHRNPVEHFWIAWQAWLLSNMLTGLTLLPLLLAISTSSRGRFPPVSLQTTFEAAALLVCLLIVGMYIFMRAPLAATVPAILYVPLPLLIWAALRFGCEGTIASLSLLATLAIWGALSGHGPFTGDDPAENLLQLQYFLIALCVLPLLLAAIVQHQRQTADALRESQLQYRMVVEDQTELICRWLPDGTFTFVNGAYCRYFQKTLEELLGRTFWQFIPPESHANTRALLASITPEDPVATIEHEVITPGGEIRIQQWTPRGFFDEQGHIVDYQAVGRDITERKRAEASLHSTMDELKRLKDRLEAQKTYLQEELTASESVGDIICRSPIMRQMLAQSQRVARTDSTVLILGETGVGKELLARTIHRSSNRADHPFVRLNCAALPPHLIESELFGHERGAFTGAAARRQGRFEVADGATLFLDEIGELPLELQAKLLRVLQEEEFERLGSSKTIKVDVRLIAATSRDLGSCVQRGTFRADLFYRLNVFPITVPPLRSRRDDIIPLASAFLAAASARLGREFGPISNAVADSLLHHDWPGNVRELENLIERAAISSRGELLELPPDWANLEIGAPLAAAGQDSRDISRPTSNKVLVTIHEIERTHVLAALQRSNWRIEGPEGAAAMLGMKPSTLRFRMKKLAITRAPH